MADFPLVGADFRTTGNGNEHWQGDVRVEAATLALCLPKWNAYEKGNTYNHKKTNKSAALQYLALSTSTTQKEWENESHSW